MRGILYLYALTPTNCLNEITQYNILIAEYSENQCFLLTKTTTEMFVNDEKHLVNDNVNENLS